jgi:hypothetical protein
MKLRRPYDTTTTTTTTTTVAAVAFANGVSLSSSLSWLLSWFYGSLATKSPR